MKGCDFIITSLQPWDFDMGSTIKSTSKEISKQNRVIYLSTPTRRLSLFGERGNGKDYIRKINDNFFVVDCPFGLFPVSKLPRGLFEFFNYLNNRKIAKQINRAVKELGFKDCIHIVDNDLYRSQYLKELVKPSFFIYYCRDYIFDWSYWKKHGKRAEEKLAAKADMVITNSTFFAERLKGLNKFIFPIETGVDLDLYDITREYSIPSDIMDIAKPIFGYIGLLSTVRLDLELLYKLSLERPNYNFVYIGPQDNDFANHKIHERPNVYFLGKKEVAQLPAYILSFDVCLNPQIVNDTTNGNYPLKVDEYLAMGKPVVATSTHTMRDVFANHTFLGTDLESYLLCLDDALAQSKCGEKIEEWIRFGHSHSWTNSVAKIYKHIEAIKND